MMTLLFLVQIIVLMFVFLVVDMLARIDDNAVGLQR